MTQCIRYCVMASLYSPPPFVTHIGRRLFYTAAVNQSEVFMFATLKRLPSAWLLLVQLVMLISAPILSSNTGTHAFSWVLSALALLLVGVVIRNSPIFNSVGFVLVGAALVLSALVALGHTEWTLWANIVEGLSYFYAAFGMIWYMLDDHVVTRDELFAAAAVFTLLVWGFAFLYSACQLVYPNSFTAAVNSEQPRTWLELLFLSFTSMSSTGLGDVIPISPPARVIASIQMFSGVMYVALIVSRLVGLVGMKR